MSKEKTVEEVREEFLDYIKTMINYWDSFKDKTSKEKLEGLAFSILSMLDGCAGNMPSFIVAPFSNPEDKNYHIENDEDYYPENHNSNVKCDIAGGLHELFCKG